MRSRQTLSLLRETIRAEALKCRYCGSLVSGTGPLTQTWYRVPEGKMVAGVCAGSRSSSASR